MLSSSNAIFNDVTDYGPPSMLIVSDDAVNVTSVMGSLPLGNKLSTPSAPSRNSLVNTRPRFETWNSKPVVSTSSQTDLECRCGYSCWYGKEVGWLHKLNTTNKHKSKQDIELREKVHFGSLRFAPNFPRKKQFRSLDAETSIAMESSNKPTIGVAEAPKVADVESESIRNNYKQTFKEIFLLLQNAHNM